MIWIGDVLVSEGEGGVYKERMLGGARVWDPYRSKLSALYYVGTGVDLTPGMRVLYLGAANGTTVSHVADYVEVGIIRQPGRGVKPAVCQPTKPCLDVRETPPSRPARDGVSYRASNIGPRRSFGGGGRGRSPPGRANERRE